MNVSVSHTRHNTTIRPFRKSDIPLIVRHVMLEVPQLPHYKGVKVEAERVEQLLNQVIDGLMDNIMVRMLVNEQDEPVGGVCAYIVTMLMSWDKATNDIFLFIRPEWRSIRNVVRLMIAYRDWAIAEGATVIRATQTGGYKQDSLGKLLERYGYEPVGTIYNYVGPRGSDIWQH